MCVSGRCHCGGLDLLALAEIQGKNEACPKLSSTSGFTVVHCTQWDIAGKILSSLLLNPMGISGKICKSLGKQLAVPKNLEENNQFHEAAKSLGWFMLGIQVGSWLEYTLHWLMPENRAAARDGWTLVGRVWLSQIGPKTFQPTKVQPEKSRLWSSMPMENGKMVGEQPKSMHFVFKSLLSTQEPVFFLRNKIMIATCQNLFA